MQRGITWDNVRYVGLRGILRGTPRDEFYGENGIYKSAENLSCLVFLLLLSNIIFISRLHYSHTRASERTDVFLLIVLWLN